MKLNDFRSESFKGNSENLKQRLGRSSTIRFTNETKEAAYEAEIDVLTQKVTKVDKISSDDSPRALSSVVTGIFLLRSILKYK